MRMRSVLAGAFGIALALATVAPARAEGPATRTCIDAATQGQKLRDEGKLLEARAVLLACTREACPAPVRADCADWLAKIDAVTPRIVLGARGSDGKDLVSVRVFANDTLVAEELLGREQRLDPGPYRFRFERHDGGGIVTVDAVLRAGDAARSIVATFPSPPGASSRTPDREPPPTGPSTKTIGLVALGAGTLLATASFVVFALRARSEYDDLRGSCAPSCTSSATQALRTDLVVADVSGIAALVLGAAFGGVALFAPSGSAAQRPADRPRIVWK
jgi:hypothetical protein